MTTIRFPHAISTEDESKVNSGPLAKGRYPRELILGALGDVFVTTGQDSARGEIAETPGFLRHMGFSGGTGSKSQANPIDGAHEHPLEESV